MEQNRIVQLVKEFLPLIINDDGSISVVPVGLNRLFGLAVFVAATCCCDGEACVQRSCSCWVTTASNAVVLPSKRPWRGSIIGIVWFPVDDGESRVVVLFTFVAIPSRLPSNERAVSPFCKPVIFVKELFGLSKSSILYLK